MIESQKSTLPILLDREEVASLLGISRATVHRAEKAGKIRGIKLGYKTTRYALSQIEDWLRAARTITVN